MRDIFIVSKVTDDSCCGTISKELKAFGDEDAANKFANHLTAVELFYTIVYGKFEHKQYISTPATMMRQVSQLAPSEEESYAMKHPDKKKRKEARLAWKTKVKAWEKSPEYQANVAEVRAENDRKTAEYQQFQKEECDRFIAFINDFDQHDDLKSDAIQKVSESTWGIPRPEDAGYCVISIPFQED